MASLINVCLVVIFGHADVYKNIGLCIVIFHIEFKIYKADNLTFSKISLKYYIILLEYFLLTIYKTITFYKKIPHKIIFFKNHKFMKTLSDS